MATYASADDVAARFDTEIPADSLPWVETKLSDAEVLVTAQAGDLAARITSGVTTAENIRIVLSEMVVRVMRNPAGYRQQAVGPFSYMMDTSLSAGRLYVSREDRRLLGLRRGAASLSLSDADTALAGVLIEPDPE